MHAYYADHFVLPLPEGHRFPMAKYRMLRDALVEQFPQIEFQEAPAATADELALAHDAAYIASILNGTADAAVLREIGFPWSSAMAERACRSVGATVAAARHVWRNGGIAANLAGGTHHGYADKGSGFCVFNDVAVAARVLQREAAAPHLLRIAVIDLDVHQGNGTAKIFQGDDSVFTLSLHGDKNFPFRKEDSDLDVALPDGTTDVPYLAALIDALQQLEQRFTPDFVFYVAGADPFEGDRLGRLKISMDGMRRRDATVFNWCRARQLPVVFAMAGGYGVDISQTVAVQCNTFAEALAAQA